MPSVLTVVGDTAYHRNHAQAVSEAGIPVRILRGWGGHLPDLLPQILAGDEEIVHLHWPEAICWRGSPGDDLLADMRTALQDLQAAGRRLAWTMHNIQPHAGDPDGFWGQLYQVFADEVDAVVHHSHSGAALARDRYHYETEHQVIIGHGFDASIPSSDENRQRARRSLGLPERDRLFCSIGALREDKGLQALIEFWQARSGSERLLIAGSPKPDMRELLGRAAHIPGILIWDRSVSVEELSLLGSAADALLFVHGQHHLTSGGPHLAQACGLPAILPGTTYNKEVLAGGACFLDPGDGLFRDLRAIIDGWSASVSAQLKDEMIASRASWSWAYLAKRYVDFYKALVA